VTGYAKVCSREQAGRDFGVYRALGRAISPSDPLLRVPRALGHSDVYRTLVIEAIAGRRLADQEEAEIPGGLRALGSALATLHDVGGPVGPRFDRFESVNLHAAVDTLRRMRPDAASHAEALADALVIAGQPRDACVCLHGDLHPKNAIQVDGRLALIDFEDLAFGPAAADLGSLLAGLAYLRAARRLSADDHDQLAQAFISGYATVRQLPDTASIRWHTAAAILVERAVRAITRIRPLGLAHLVTLLTDARRLVGCPAGT
jgi:Ser/Thr protein kinase RdoA (MazF antagonist)